MHCNLKTALFALILLISKINLAFAECPTLSGDFSQGGVIFGTVKDGFDVYFSGKKVAISPENKFIIGFSRDQDQYISLKIVDKKTLKRTTCKIRVDKVKWKLDYVNGVEAGKVTPKKEFLSRIKKEADLINFARKELSTDFFPNSFTMPLTGRISGVFGSQRFFNGKPRAFHSGTDIASPNGTEIKAIADGKIALAYDDMFFNGNVIIIDHGYFVNSTYAHLSEILVKQGDIIKQGQVIGKVGSTGRSTGNHLHMTVNVLGNNIDPLRLIEKNPVIQEKQVKEKTNLEKIKEFFDKYINKIKELTKQDK